MIGLAFALILQVASPDVVVTGQRLEEAYRRCAARQCTPLEDARASIAYAEELFRRGRYQDAKRLLGAATTRNRAHAASDPRPVSALYEAYATVTLHEGDLERYRGAVANEVNTLRDHLPADDPAVVESGLALGDMWVKLGHAENAERAYSAVERQATKAGRPSTAVLAVVRRAILASGMGQYAEASALIDGIEARHPTLDPTIRAVLPAIKLRLAAKRADDQAVDALVAKLGSGATSAPVLVWAPRYEKRADAEVDRLARRFGDVRPSQSTGFTPIQWVDVGFWIRPDGRTGEAEVLRGTPARAWTAPVIDQIARRRYTASAGTGPGLYRVERITQRAIYEKPIRSLIPQRAGPVSIEVLDLTAPAGAGAPGK